MEIHREQHTPNCFIESFVGIIRREERYILLFTNDSHNAMFVNHLKSEALSLLISTFHIDPENYRARYALEFYVSGIIPVIGSWMKNGEGVSVETLAETIKGILKDGILKQLVSIDL